jgi:DSF synthase
MSAIQCGSEASFENFDLQMQSMMKNESTKFSNLRQQFEQDKEILWLYMNPKGRQCFSIDLLKDMRAQHEALLSNRGMCFLAHAQHNVRYQVLTSDSNRPYNLGGDLELFVKCIKSKDRSSLKDYARLCIDVLFPTAINFDSTVTTISLVRGQALGGGFESALSSSILVAERSAKLGLPEVLFNLFPGMGAYHLLARKLPVAQVEKMIMSGNVYGAEELYEMGVVDILAEDGEGEKEIYDYVDKHKRHFNTQIGLQKARQLYQPITHDDLMDVCEVWVDTAMQLGPKDLRVMERLVRAQYKMNSNENIKPMRAIA